MIEAGDPYKRQIEATVRLVVERGGWTNPVTVCYQSKVGNQKWLQPTLHETIAHLGENNVENVLVVPIAFVSDHVETLAEIDIEAREEAAEHGIPPFRNDAGAQRQSGIYSGACVAGAVGCSGETGTAPSL